MTDLARKLAERSVPEGSVAIYWLAQAGFAFKTSSGQVIYIDPYLSDVVERVIGFKRMMSSPIDADQVTANLIICTHEHLDHMDVDALPVIARVSGAHFAGPIECMKEFERLGIPSERCHLLKENKSIELDGIRATAVYADHGELAPDALGVVLELDGIRIYHTGDTAFRPEEFGPVIQMKADVLLPCINGAFGNMDWSEAVELTRMVAPRLVIPSHFWMFVEQNGNPAKFFEACTSRAPEVKAALLKPGEEYLFQK